MQGVQSLLIIPSNFLSCPVMRDLSRYAGLVPLVRDYNLVTSLISIDSLYSTTISRDFFASALPAE